MTIKQVNRI